MVTFVERNGRLQEDAQSAEDVAAAPDQATNRQAPGEDRAVASPSHDDIFKIVTPAYNAARYIEETLISVVAQVTRGTLHYHVQDGGSTDGTLDILKLWTDRLKQGRFTATSVALHFSFASEPDAGMYDAVNKGFRVLDVAPGDILTWINADDRLPQGALATVAQVLRDVPDCRFISGRVSILTAEGAITGVNAAGVYAQADLAAGRHDGRSLPFVMQEGTFFRGAVWLEVGGADTRFRLAGDWDLWRRMARREQHYSLDSVTGFHRRRPGQLSEDMARYYAEVDAAVREPSPEDVLAQEGNLIRYQANFDAWRSVKVDPFAVYPFDLVAEGVSEAAVSWRYGKGFGPPEGPYPEYNLPANVRWITDTRGCVQATVPVVGRYTVRARLRASQRRPLVRFFVEPRMVHERELVAPRAMVDAIVEFSCWLSEGCNVISVEAGDADRDAPTSVGDVATLLVISFEISTDRALTMQEIARRRSASNGIGGCGDVAFVVRSRGHAEQLDATLSALVVAGAGRRSIFVETDGDPLTQELAQRFEPHVEALVEPDSTSDEAFRRKGFEWRLDVVVGDRLVAGSLEIARGAMHSRHLDVIHGLIDGFDCFGRLTCRLIDTNSGMRLLSGNTTAQSGIMGYPLFLRNNTNFAEAAGSNPRLVLHEAVESKGRLPLLVAVAKGFALLGCDTSLVHAQQDSITIACGDQTLRGQIEIHGVEVRIALDSMPDIICPAGYDTDAFRYVTRQQARRLFGVDNDILTIALVATSEPMAEKVFLEFVSLLKQSRHIGIILCSGKFSDPGLDCFTIADMRETFDFRSENYVIAAADVLFDFGTGIHRLGPAAAMIRTPVVRSEETALDFVRQSTAYRRGLEKKRDVAIAWHSHEAFALSFREQALRLMPEGLFSHWLTQRKSLASGSVEVRTDHAGLLNAKASCLLVPILGARWATSAPEESFIDAIVCFASSAVLALEVRELDVRAIHMRVTADRNGYIEIGVDDLPPAEVLVSERAELNVTVDALLVPGTHRIDIKTGLQPESFNVTVLDYDVLASATSGLRVPKDRPTLTFMPRFGKEKADLSEHGDWQRLDGFHETESPHPQFGLHEEFCWSKQSFEIAIWCEHDGDMTLTVSVRGNHRGQRLHLRSANIDYGWCEPLSGDLASKLYCRWNVGLRHGSNKLEFEVSSVTGTSKDRIIGVILQQLFFEAE